MTDKKNENKYINILFNKLSKIVNEEIKILKDNKLESHDILNILMSTLCNMVTNIIYNSTVYDSQSAIVDIFTNQLKEFLNICNNEGVKH